MTPERIKELRDYAKYSVIRGTGSTDRFKAVPSEMLTEALDALEESMTDKDRLDWLEKHIQNGWEVGNTTWFTRVGLEDLRAAIDAARSAEKNKIDASDKL